MGKGMGLISRREFIGGVAASAAAVYTASNLTKVSAQGGVLNIVVFWEDDFHSVDGFELEQREIRAALSGHKITFVAGDALAKALTANVDVFINPFGSAFPRNGWKAILKYLQDGGNLLNLGGKPFSIPIGADKDSKISQTSYHKRLGITQYFSVDMEKHEDFVTTDTSVKFEDKPVQIFETYLKLTSVNDFPEDSGSDGRREARVTALVYGQKNTDSDDRLIPISAPIIAIDRLQGEFAGGRWVLANYEGAVSGLLLRALVDICSIGAFELTATPVHAKLLPDEKLGVRINLTVPKNNLQVTSAGLFLGEEDESINESGMPPFQPNTEFVRQFTVPETGCCVGSLRIGVKLKGGRAFELESRFGFWIGDGEPVEGGAVITANRHNLLRNGAPFVVTGTTYMSSSVARRFLLEPNPLEWDRDFGLMKEAGVNMVRTGIWMGWKAHLDAKGAVKEEVLRAFDAFILTSLKHEIPVMFTFFAFIPELFGGKSAYLDPRSIEGQKKFMAAFASRVKGVNSIIWDLINEPSFANPKQLWSCRPNYDEFEKAAWKEWLKKRFEETDENLLAGTVSAKWRLREDEEPFALPTNRDFDNVNIHVERRPLRAMDFRLFAQDAFNGWVRTMSEALREAGGPQQLVTVGQDEAGTNDSPAQQFHAEVVDLTGLHNWWANDDLLWDAVVTKSPSKPNLVQETGVMFYEKQDGAAVRTDADSADLLERKMALSVGANGAGFIQWIWNSNPFMDNENESAIGFLRADGTFKDELDRFMDISLISANQSSRFVGREEEDILMVIPQSQMFSPRNLATEATKKAVRALHYHCRQTCRAVGEHQLQQIEGEDRPPRLIILPAPRTLSSAAWQSLLNLVEDGSYLLLSGYFEEDEYFLPAERMAPRAMFKGFRSVRQFESVKIEERNYNVRFAGEKIQRVDRALSVDDSVQESSDNEGRILWMPVPLENGEDIAPIAAFYQIGINIAGIPRLYTVTGADESILIRPTVFKDAVLYTMVNEGSKDARLRLTQRGARRPLDVTVSAGRTRVILLDRASGAVIA
jgi:hypothetical protein